MDMWDRLRHGWATRGLDAAKVERLMREEYDPSYGENRISKMSHGKAVPRFDEVLRLVAHAGIRPWWIVDPNAPLVEPVTDLTDGERGVIETIRALRLPAGEAIRRLHQPAGDRPQIVATALNSPLTPAEAVVSRRAKSRRSEQE